MTEIMQMSADYFSAIGISTPAPGYGIVKNNMDNVPSKLLNSWQYPTPRRSTPLRSSSSRVSRAHETLRCDSIG